MGFLGRTCSAFLLSGLATHSAWAGRVYLYEFGDDGLAFDYENEWVGRCSVKTFQFQTAPIRPQCRSTPARRGRAELGPRVRPCG